MRRIRLFADVDLVSGTETTLPVGPSHHLVNVLRQKSGANFVVFNGRGGEFDATLMATAKSGVTMQVGVHHELATESPLAITLAQGIAKGERMDYAIQKATELGVARIQPVLCERSEVRLDAKRWAKKQAHWQGVAVAASEQSGREQVPPVLSPLALLDFVASDIDGPRWMLDPDGDADLQVGDASQASVLIGPEGGFSSAEIAVASRAGWQRLRLGPRVFRSETAGMVAISLLQSVAGDLR